MDELAFYSATKLAQMIRKGELSGSELLGLYLCRIENLTLLLSRQRVGPFMQRCYPIAVPWSYLIALSLITPPPCLAFTVIRA